MDSRYLGSRAFMELSDLCGSFKTRVALSLSPDFPTERWAFEELAFEDVRRASSCPSLPRPGRFSLQFNSTWDAQIDHQDGGGVLEIIGSLLSIANIAVRESRGNSHGCCLSYHVKMYLCITCVVCVVYVMCINVAFVWSVRAHGILIDIDEAASGRGEKSGALTEIYLHNLVVSTTRRFRINVACTWV